ncbi:MAG: patatin-like phospholipase family protein [Sulfurimonadaceae bacterium]|nr:patatin-like phospholipase family protein [Sulfurimonadaceae bacterium]
MTIDQLKANDFSLVLSGGGALGIAHLGVLHDLEKYGLVPAEIVGTSMGGIIGACAAIGMKEHEIYKLVDSISDLFNWISFSFSGNAVVQHEKIEQIFLQVFEKRTMSDTAIPLKLIATNLLNGHKRVFTASDDILIKDALLATMAIPGIFEEKQINGAVYVDGFLCENLGISESSCDHVIAVDVMSRHSFFNALPDNFLKASNVLEMFEKAVRLMIFNQTQSSLARCDKELILIEPETRHYKTYHFHKTTEIRALGLDLLE